MRVHAFIESDWANCQEVFQPFAYTLTISSIPATAMTLLHHLLKMAGNSHSRHDTSLAVFNWLLTSELVENLKPESKVLASVTGLPSGPRLFEHASPLMPLQKRDSLALASLFDRTDIHEIQDDVSEQLSRLHPEPCWEEEPLNFLRDFL